MTRPARHFLVFTLIAWHGLAIVLGPCAHVLVGSNHHAAWPLDRDGDGDRRRDSANSEDALRAIDDSADCPVCQFVAQGQLGASPPAPTSSHAVGPLADPDSPFAVPLAPPLHALPRAPPLSLLA